MGNGTSCTEHKHRQKKHVKQGGSWLCKCTVYYIGHKREQQHRMPGLLLSASDSLTWSLQGKVGIFFWLTQPLTGLPAERKRQREREEGGE